MNYYSTITEKDFEIQIITSKLNSAGQSKSKWREEKKAKHQEKQTMLRNAQWAGKTLVLKVMNKVM